MDLTIEKKVQESLLAVRDKAKLEAEEGLKLKVAEKDELIAAMQRQVEELKRRAEQGSQQMQGEIQELELESLLRSTFPLDSIEPVAKGEHGGDVIHRVVRSRRSAVRHDFVGIETDQELERRLARQAARRPARRESRNRIDRHAGTSQGGRNLQHCRRRVGRGPPLCRAGGDRIAIFADRTGRGRQAGEGQQSKMELVYQYFTGPRFRHRIQAIVEKFTDMNEDLDKSARR